MIGSVWAKTGVCILVAALGASGVVAVVHIYGPAATSASPADAALPITISNHTAAWYVAHPDVLQQDQKRCSGDAATISRSSCQNADSADEQLTEIQMQKAADENNASSNSVAPNDNKAN
jgi:hypothetical protein